MATAEELVAADLFEDNSMLIIDNDLRTIMIPPSITNLGVESDEDVLRLYFRMPKMYGEFDLSSFSIRINYINADGQGDVYIVDDAYVDGDGITFSWLIGRFVAKTTGSVRFIVCLKHFDADGQVDKEYNTTITSLPVLKGLETSSAVVTKNPQILEDILLKLEELIDAYRVYESPPTKYIESTGANPVIIRDLNSGTYAFYGIFLPYQGSTSSISFESKLTVNVVRNTEMSYVQVFYPVNNYVQYLEITNDSYERINICLNNITDTHINSLIDEKLNTTIPEIATNDEFNEMINDVFGV